MSKLIKSVFFSIIFGVTALAYADTQTTAAPVTENVTSAKIAKASLQEKININSADTKALMKVKYIGKKKAQEIVDYRAKNGNFKSVDDLLSIKSRGINQKWLDKVKDHITV
jgi:competence protein ComEA